MRSENRKFIRFQVKGRVYAALGSHFRRVGRIIDISIGGLAFEFIENAEGCCQDLSKITIFHSEDGFYLPNLNCLSIYDHPICVMDTKLTINPIHRTKRCGVQFTATTVKQERELEFLLNNYTCGLVPSSQELIISP